MMKYASFFRIATGGAKPYPYQERFAAAEPIPHLLRAPTGAGKTATAILGWLYRRYAKAKATPRRLVYCLPMRVLVEQSVREAKGWIENLKKHVNEPLLEDSLDVQVLMGGIEAEAEPWHLHPERSVILIGTQDMLLSRALNRGYAASRFHWPIDFGLLNNDCLWIFDEPQLMAGGVATSAQLAGLRKKLGTFNACPSVWMSATLEPTWLDTIDFVGQFAADPLELTGDDHEPLKKRMTATKTLASLGLSSSKDMKDPAKQVLANHKAGTQTLVVVNTVDRAKALYVELERLQKKAETPALLLVHSRFRPHEREQLNEALQDKSPGDRILVATQVVEAGVDVSSRTLFTELAPWPSLVQRMGRCNRTGNDGPGQVYWLDLDEKNYPPYDERDLVEARDYLEMLEGEQVSSKALDKFKEKEGFTLRLEHKHVIRRRDLLDLFDTAPDLSGNDIDVQRFVRSDDPDTDVQVFWREIPPSGPNTPSLEVEPSRGELCNVPIFGPSGLKEFLKKTKSDAFVWDHLDGEWKAVRDPGRELRPGIQVMLPAEAGGYALVLGWNSESRAYVTPWPPKKEVPPEGVDSDRNSLESVPLTIAEHTQNVCNELAEILGDEERGLCLPDDWPTHLARAARWHDLGKGHEVFCRAMELLNGQAAEGQQWAKSGKKGRLNYCRKYFRHELASALAALQQKLAFAEAYLIAAHHGRPRLAIRALPDETPPTTPDTLFALGVHHGDRFGPVDLGGETCPAVTLDLSPMQLGGESSWTAAALRLLEELGPFKLAYLEAVLRAADVRASRKEAQHHD